MLRITPHIHCSTTWQKYIQAQVRNSVLTQSKIHLTACKCKFSESDTLKEYNSRIYNLRNNGQKT